MRRAPIKTMTDEEAQQLINSDFCETASSLEIVTAQLSTDILICPISVYQKALGEQLQRPVFTHELGDRRALLEELMGDSDSPTNWQVLEKFRNQMGDHMVVLEIDEDDL